MNLRTYARRIGLSLTMGAASLTVLAVTASVRQRGRALQRLLLRVHPRACDPKAIDDAEVSAFGEGLFNCEIVGEPQVWIDGSKFRASVNMACS